jgi:hypothetical protein
MRPKHSLNHNINSVPLVLTGNSSKTVEIAVRRIVAAFAVACEYTLGNRDLRTKTNRPSFG